MWSFNSPVLCQTESWRVKPSEPVKKLRTFFAISEVPCPSLYIVNDVSSRADGKYLEKFSTFFSKNFRPPPPRRSVNRVSLATTKSSIDRRPPLPRRSANRVSLATTKSSIDRRPPLPRRSANRVSLATTKSSIDRFRRFYNSSTLSRTHKSLLARATPSIRYRSPVIGLPTHEVLVRQRAGESNRKSR